MIDKFFIVIMTIVVIFNLIIAFLPLDWVSTVNFLAAFFGIWMVAVECKKAQKRKPEDWTTVE
jgi:Flp pilus assembly protein TadB